MGLKVSPGALHPRRIVMRSTGAGRRIVIRPSASGGSGGGVTDHGALTGLGDDDHPQYALADGTRGAFATTAQGDLADTAVQPSALSDAITAHTAATDPHGDRAYTDAQIIASLANFVAGAPGILDTWLEMVTAIQADQTGLAALTTVVAGKLAKASNLSDLADIPTARTNLGLGSAATTAASAYDAAGTAAAAQAAAIAAAATDATAKANAMVADAINDGTTTVAPSQNAVYDALALKQPLDADLTAIAALAPSDDALIQRKAGAWTSRTPAQVKADMSIGVGDVSGLDENTRDVIGTALVAGSGVAVTVDDPGNTITIAMADAATVLAALGVGWRKVDLQTAASAASSLSANLGVAGALKYRIHWRARSTANAVSATAGFRINSSSASDYTMAGGALTTSGYFGLMAGSQTNSDRWGAGVLEITPGPVAANAWSLLQGLESRVNSTATVTSHNSPIAGAWRDSVGAGMSTIQMIPSAGNLDVGSFMYVEVLL